jgi:hypothetical protein
VSCELCNQVQDDYDKGDPAKYPIGQYYIRVGTGNVQIVACDIHTRQTMEAIRKGTHGV